MPEMPTSERETKDFARNESSDSTPSPAKKTEPQVGSYLYTEKLGACDTIIWSDSGLYRIPDCPPLRSLTPILFLPQNSPGPTIGKLRASTNYATFVNILYDDHPSSPLFLNGTFAKKNNDQMHFFFNPGNFLSHGVRLLLSTGRFPNLAHNTPLLAQIAICKPKYNSIPPYLKAVRQSDGSSPYTESNANILPPALIRDMAESPSFTPFAAIGISDNEYIPTLSFTDFCKLYDADSLTWASIKAHILRKYEQLAEKEKKDQEKKETHFQKMHDRLIKHQRGGKSIVIFPGRWSALSPSLAETLAQDALNANFNSSIIRLAHPHSTLDTIAEMNPHIFSSVSSTITERLVTRTQVGLGEMDDEGVIHFGFSYNQRFLIFCRINKPVNNPTIRKGMLAPATPFDFTHYSHCFRDTESDCGDGNYVMLSLRKGDQLPTSSLDKAKIFSRDIIDDERVWSYFNIFQLFSPYREITDKLVNTALRNPSASCGKGVCGAMLVSSPCTPQNALCIIKLGRTRAIAELPHRAAPLTILQELGLIDQALPLSNFFIKVKLATGCTIENMCEAVAEVNKLLNDNLFHSVYDGERTRLISQREPAPSTHFLVIENPPSNLNYKL